MDSTTSDINLQPENSKEILNIISNFDGSNDILKEMFCKRCLENKVMCIETFLGSSGYESIFLISNIANKQEKYVFKVANTTSHEIQIKYREKVLFQRRNKVQISKFKYKKVFELKDQYVCYEYLKNVVQTKYTIFVFEYWENSITLYKYLELLKNKTHDLSTQNCSMIFASLLLAIGELYNIGVFLCAIDVNNIFVKFENEQIEDLKVFIDDDLAIMPGKEKIQQNCLKKLDYCERYEFFSKYKFSNDIELLNSIFFKFRDTIKTPILLKKQILKPQYDIFDQLIDKAMIYDKEMNEEANNVIIKADDIFYEFEEMNQEDKNRIIEADDTYYKSQFKKKFEENSKKLSEFVKNKVVEKFQKITGINISDKKIVFFY